MMGRTHFTTGLTAGAAVTAAALAVGVPREVALLAGPVTAYAALLPDLDHPRSTVTYSLGPVTVALSWLLCLFVDHRGATHRPEWAPAWTLPLGVSTAYLPEPLGGWSALLWWVALTVGWWCHLWGDARTLSGIPWAGAWRSGWWGRTNGGRLRLGRTFRTGSPDEEARLVWIYGPVATGSWVAVGILLAALGPA